MDDPDAAALAWWTGLSTRNRSRYRRRLYRGNDVLLIPHAHDLAAAGLEPPGWWIVQPGSSAADNDRAHRLELSFGLKRKYVMPDPVRRLILTDLDRTPLTGPGLNAPPRWWRRSRSR